MSGTEVWKRPGALLHSCSSHIPVDKLRNTEPLSHPGDCASVLFLFYFPSGASSVSPSPAPTRRAALTGDENLIKHFSSDGAFS